jgi:hypothetical protein
LGLGLGGYADFHAKISGEADGIRRERGAVAFNFLKIGQVHPIPKKSDHRSVFSLVQGEDGEFPHAGR